MLDVRGLPCDWNLGPATRGNWFADLDVELPQQLDAGKGRVEGGMAPILEAWEPPSGICGEVRADCFDRPINVNRVLDDHSFEY